MFFRDCDPGAVVVLDCSSCRRDQRECKGELTSHNCPAAEGQNQVAAKVILVVLVCKGQPVRKAQSWPACLIKWCIVILPRRDNKRGSALPPPYNGSGGGGHRESLFRAGSEAGTCCDCGEGLPPTSSPVSALR